jgi:hypothetical protein
MTINIRIILRWRIAPFYHIPRLIHNYNNYKLHSTQTENRCMNYQVKITNRARFSDRCRQTHNSIRNIWTI